MYLYFIWVFAVFLTVVRVSGSRITRQAEASTSFWTTPDKIPINYEILPNIDNDFDRLINDAVKSFEENTCVKFQKSNQFNEGVSIGPGKCKTQNGRVANTKRKMKLGSECKNYGYVARQFLKVLGPSVGEIRLNKTGGRLDGATFVDFQLINQLYCKNKCNSPGNCKNGGYPNPNNCNKCNCPLGLAGSTCDAVPPSSPTCKAGEFKASDSWQSFSSPNHPNAFNGDLHCHWIIRAPPGKQVRMEFMGTFDFPCGDLCDSYVEVKTAKTFQSTGSRYCCNKLPTDKLTSLGDKLVVILRTSPRDANKGFQAKFKYI